MKTSKLIHLRCRPTCGLCVYALETVLPTIFHVNPGTINDVGPHPPFFLKIPDDQLDFFFFTWPNRLQMEYLKIYTVHLGLTAVLQHVKRYFILYCTSGHVLLFLKTLTQCRHITIPYCMSKVQCGLLKAHYC